VTAATAPAPDVWVSILRKLELPETTIPLRILAG
jgi:hypothetical protein